jgi:hypothetical protein
VAVVMLVGAAVWVLFVRDQHPSPGPLESPEMVSIGIRQHPGDAFGYGLGLVYNHGDRPASLQRIRLIKAAPELEVLATRVGGPDRDLLGLTSSLTWPTDEFTDLRPVAGFTLAPKSQPQGERGAELIFGLRAPQRPGRYEAKAIAVEYTVDGTEHVFYLRAGIRVCVVAPSEPVEGPCGTVRGMDDPIPPGS